MLNIFVLFLIASVKYYAINKYIGEKPMVKDNDKINKNLVKKDPFLGSIRAEDADIFHEQSTTKIASWKYNTELHGTFSERCLTKQLIKLFEKLNVSYQVDPNPEPSFDLVKGLPGLSINDIKQDGKNHIRIFFGGITQADFDNKRNMIEKFLYKNDIAFENYCLYICVTGQKQQELTDKYMNDIDKLNK